MSKTTPQIPLDFVNGLWIGKTLSPLELLCLNSFTALGHTFRLWMYQQPDTPLPDGVIVMDANDIIPHDQVFAYNNTDQFGHGKGSYAGFSDVFRYKLLYENGGWWTDMDVVCVKPLVFDEPYVFRTHHNFDVVGNIMKCPPRSPCMFDCYNEAVLSVNALNTNWHLPIEILNRNIVKHQLTSFINEMSNPDKWLTVRLYLLWNMPVKPNWYVIHLMNEEWRINKIDKIALFSFTTIGRLLKAYGLHQKFSLFSGLRNYLSIFFPRGSVKYLFWKLWPRLR